MQASRVFTFLFLVQAFGLLTFGQIKLSAASESTPAGKVKTAVYKRTFTIWKRTHVSPASRTVALANFDHLGRILRSSTFGDSERRITYDYSQKLPSQKVEYFDFGGQPQASSSLEFVPPWDEPNRSDLCKDFTTRTEINLKKKLKTETEECRNGLVRLVRTFQSDDRGYLYREFVVDAKNRTFEDRYEYDADGVETKWTYIVNDRKKPEYWVEVRYADTKLDQHKNWTRTNVTVVNSLFPNQPSYQFIEEQILSYYD